MGVGLELPAGFRFHPTDEELVYHYLCKKCSAQPISVPIIAEIDLYKYDPWQLPGMALHGEKEWYFFSPRDRKYPKGSRPNRAARSGYWKATGADKPVGEPRAVGIKKALVFYAGRAPNGVKTNWIMHEYRLANVDRSPTKGKTNQFRLDDWVLCRLYNKKGRIEVSSPADRRSTAFVKAETDELMKMWQSPQANSMSDMSGLLTGSAYTHGMYPDGRCHKEVQSQAGCSYPDYFLDARGSDHSADCLQDIFMQDIFTCLEDRIPQQRI